MLQVSFIQSFIHPLAIQAKSPCQCHSNHVFIVAVLFWVIVKTFFPQSDGITRTMLFKKKCFSIYTFSFGFFRSNQEESDPEKGM